MTLDANALLLVDSIGADIGKAVKECGSLSLLATITKHDLVVAINELNANLVAQQNKEYVFDPAVPTTDSVYSSTHFIELIAQLKNDIVAGAPETFDTLKEIHDYIVQDENNLQSLILNLAGTVQWAASQSLTTEQQLQACENMGLGDPKENVLYDYYVASDTNTYVTPGYVIPGYVA